MPTPDFTTTPPERPGALARLADETVPYGIWITGADGGVLYLSDSYLDLAGMTLEECQGTGWASNIHPEEAGAVLAAWEHAVATGKTWSRNYRILGADGEYHTIASRGVPIRDASGQIILWAGANLDLTDRDELQGEVRELQTLYAISRLIGEGGVDLAEVFRRTAALLPGGFGHPELVSAEVVSGTPTPGAGGIAAPITAGGRPAGHLVVETAGPIRPQERDLVGAVAAMLGAAVAQAEAKQETLASERQYRLLFDQMLDAGFILAIVREVSGEPAGFRVIHINRQAEEGIGRRRDEVAGEDLVRVVPSLNPATLDLLSRVARTGTAMHREVYNPALDAYHELKAYQLDYDRIVLIVNDITDRRRAEELLRKQQTDLDNRVRELAVLYAMTGIVERPGVSVDEILQEVASILPGSWLHREDAAARIIVDGREYLSAGFGETAWRQESLIVVHGRTAGRVEVCYRHKHPGEDEGPFLASERLLIDAVAERLGRIIERVRADEGLRRSEEKYRLLFEQMLESYTLYEVVRDGERRPVDYRLLEVNENAARVFGRAPEDLVGRLLFDIFPAIREGASALYGEVAETGVPVQRRLQEPGTGRWYELHIYRPQPGRLAVTGQDITEQKTAEVALRASEKRFREIAQRSFDMIYTCYVDRGITYISPAVTRVLGYAPEEMVGVQCSDYVLDETRPAWQEARARIARGVPVEGLLVELRRKDGTTAALEMNESPIIEDGRVVGVQVTARDISDRKHYEDLRMQAFYQIEQNIEQFAILADHIRLPLQVILGMADLVDDGEASEKIRGQVERINGIIKQLDEGWVESREVREFLRRNELV